MVFGSKKDYTRSASNWWRPLQEGHRCRVETSDPRHCRPVTACEIVFLNARPGEPMNRLVKLLYSVRYNLGYSATGETLD